MAVQEGSDDPLKPEHLTEDAVGSGVNNSFLRSSMEGTYRGEWVRHRLLPDDQRTCKCRVGHPDSRCAEGILLWDLKEVEIALEASGDIFEE